VTGERVDVSIYSVGDFDVATIAAKLGGGGHRNAAGFSLTLAEWAGGVVSRSGRRPG
jgi:nanoRNase/pAp phosphatase (c-di-AMP/oligoRNAs hydrolase)